MACCDWETYRDSFLGAWARDKTKASVLLIDWKKAKNAWQKYHCTGGEAARAQLTMLKKEAEYQWIANSRKDKDDPDDRGPRWSPGPSPQPTPSPMLA